MPAPLLDVRVERIALSPGRTYVCRPADWQALRTAERMSGRPVPYWAVPWPSGKALARAVARDPPARGARVLELGCGLALPSVEAARAGAEVLATDSSPDAVVFAAHTMALNDVPGDVTRADWTEAGDLLAERPWDLVLAADVLYLRENTHELLRLLPRVLGDTGEAWIADPGRSAADEFLAVAERLWTVSSTDAEDEDGVRLHRLRPRPPG